MQKPSLNTIIAYGVFLIIIIVTSIVGIYTAKQIQKEQHLKIIIVKQEERLLQYPDFNSIKGRNRDPKIKQTIIAKNHINYEPVTAKRLDGVTKNFRVKGQFSRAYLYIEAAVDNNRPLTVWDDVYVKINESGGHLVPDVNSLPVPASEISRYLYDLRSICYYPTIEDKEKKAVSSANLFELLRDKKKLKIFAFISSNRPEGVMREVSIYYECFKGSTCSIEEIKK